MLQRILRPLVHSKVKGHDDITRTVGSESISLWTQEERDLLQEKVIDYLSAEPVHCMYDMLIFEPTFRALLCSPKDEVYDRFITLLVTLNVTSGLMFAATASSTLSPINISLLDEDRKQYGEIFNITAAFVCVCQLMYTLISTFVLVGFASTATSHSAMYRSILLFGQNWGGWMFTFFFPMLGIAVCLIPLAQLVYNENPLSRWLGFYLPIVVAVLLLWVYNFGYSRFGMEHMEWSYFGVDAPWMWYLRPNFRADTKRFNATLLASARKNVLDVIEKEKVTDAENIERTKGYDEMYSILLKVLPEITKSQMESVVDSLLSADLTVERLRDAASIANGGCQLIALYLSDQKSLSHGQQLAIATYFGRGS